MILSRTDAPCQTNTIFRNAGKPVRTAQSPDGYIYPPRQWTVGENLGRFFERNNDWIDQWADLVEEVLGMDIHEVDEGMNA